MAEQEPTKKPVERKPRERYVDISGLRYGEVSVISFAGRSPNRRHANWHCRCDCGVNFITSGMSLRAGDTKSCGCLKTRPKVKKYSIEQRFWAKVNKGDGTGCWLWMGYLTDFGYGTFSPMHGGHILAHRWSYELAFGDIPEGLCVLHRCDVPACIRPDHLWVGTKADNSRDMATKGRSTFGERHFHAKLTWDQVQDIRTRYSAGGITKSDLARRFGVSPTTIASIIIARRWRRDRSGEVRD